MGLSAHAREINAGRKPHKKGISASKEGSPLRRNESYLKPDSTSNKFNKGRSDITFNQPAEGDINDQQVVETNN